MGSTLVDKIAIVTGAGQGLGREEALLLAAEGAVVVVNDIGGPGDDGVRAADSVVSEMESAGGRGVANYDDVSDWDGAVRLFEAAMALGGLDILVCNAGIVRDRMVHKMSVDEWDAVVRVHLRGHFIPTRLAAEYWRNKAKESGRPADARLIYTTSEAALYGRPGQSNYAAAKAGIIALGQSVANELESFGVTVNVISPRGRTPMTVGAFGDIPTAEGFDEWDAGNVAPFIAFLSGPHASRISGQLFLVFGGMVTRMERWRPGARISANHRWTVEDLVDAVPGIAPDLIAEPEPFPDELLPSGSGA